MAKKVKKARPQFRSAEELEITPGERKWLIKTAAVLAKMRPDQAVKVDGMQMRFDLSTWFRNEDWRTSNECGTAGCIKGWMGSLAMAKGKGKELGITERGQPKRYVEMSSECPMADWNQSYALNSLFVPNGIRLHVVTPVAASKAITKFLKTGAVKRSSFPQSCHKEEYREE